MSANSPIQTIKFAGAINVSTVNFTLGSNTVPINVGQQIPTPGKFSQNSGCTITIPGVEPLNIQWLGANITKINPEPPSQWKQQPNTNIYFLFHGHRMTIISFLFNSPNMSFWVSLH